MNKTEMKKAPFPETNIFIGRGPAPREIVIKRRKRVRQGKVVGPAQPQEIEIIREFYPEVLEDAGIE